MLVRIRLVFAHIWEGAMYFLTPAVAVLFVIYLLLTRAWTQRDGVIVAAQDEKFKEIEDEKKRVDALANSTVLDYERIRGEYLRGYNHSLRQGPGGAEGTDSDSGPGNNPGPDTTKH